MYQEGKGTYRLFSLLQTSAAPLLDKSIAPTMWMGNQAMVAPHYDPYDNLAAVVAGRREFTLFPPE